MSIFNPSRRDLLRMAAVMPALTLPALSLSRPAQASLGAPARANAGHFSFGLGAARLTVVSDGHLEIPAMGLGVNADPEAVKAFLENHFLSTSINYSHTNHIVIELGDAVVLVDVGSGARFLPTAGKLLENLEAAGIDPASVTDVVITHAHPDHIWGIRDDFDEPILPEARYHLGQAEYAYWMQDGLTARAEPAAQQFIVGAVNSINVEGVEWSLLSHEQEIAPGIRVIDTPGHTAGHLAVIVESEGQQLIALGDAMNHVYANFAHPDWYNSFDEDGPLAVQTRRRLLDMAATDRMAVLGYHFPFPGVGHVRRQGDAYRFIPAHWQW
ncbi:MAG: MBL fold metallo-hydrolase [Pelagimonas sp.]|jgi:glyoxylase-like metal-dependent hydrolase (beta-lactamase superfamily II)|nr:MBL fold metallo-hydrolase [Pelagimonas sp.]